MALSNAKIKQAVQKAIATVGDVASLVTYVKVTPGTYDPTTDTQADTETNYPNTRVVLTSLTETEMDWFPTDRITQKAIIAALDLPIVPTVPDYLIIDSIRWEVKSIKNVPGKSVFILFIQEP